MRVIKHRGGYSYMKYNKKVTGILVATVLATSSLMGCGSFDETAVALTVGDNTMSAGEANFYSRFQQSVTETYYSYFLGEDMWDQDIEEGVTYQENVKEQIITSFTELLATEQHAEELGVSLTEEEKAEIQTAADSFVSENDTEVLGKVSGTKEHVVRILELFTLEAKCRPIMVADVDKEVSDEEAAQKKVAYTAFNFTKTDDEGQSVQLTEDEIAEQRTNAEELLAKAKEAGDLVEIGEGLEYTVNQSTFDSETTTLAPEIIEAVDVLSEGDFPELIETDSAIYIAQLVSEFDKDATDTKKLAIISEREQELYQSTVDEWVAALDVVVNQKVWDSIDFQSIAVTMVSEEEPTEDTTEE